jgi:hypothetical protein
VRRIAKTRVKTGNAAMQISGPHPPGSAGSSNSILSSVREIIVPIAQMTKEQKAAGKSKRRKIRQKRVSFLRMR